MLSFSRFSTIQTLREAKGLDIEEISKVRGGVQRASIIADVIDKQTKIETSKGNVSIDWLSPEIKAAYLSGDFNSAFKDGNRYRNAFKTSKGDEIKLSDILKSKMFGGGKGSGGGAENTALTEAAQCLYCAGVFHVVGKMNLDEYLDDSLLGEAARYVDIDVPVTKISQELTDDWIESSILIANELRKQLGSGKWIFHRGSQFVNQISNVFSKLNKSETPKPFSNLNKWSPADIWCVKQGANFDFEQYSTLGEFNNQLKELYDKKLLVGVSLKKASGGASLKEFNTKGFVRRPAKFEGYQLYARDMFSSKDMYIKFGGKTMQLRSFDKVKSWQGEVKGTKAAGGKIGGGILESILFQQTKVKFKYDQNQIKSLAKKPTPQFLQEMYELYLTLEKKRPMPQKEFIDKVNSLKGVNGDDWRYSKYMSMFYVAQIVKNKSAGNKICDNIAGYSLSSSDLSAPFIKAM